MRYFISSLPVKVKQFAHAVRSHWGIENSCHWCLDVTYREDESRIRDDHLRENFAWLNRLTLSLLKQHPAKDSVAMKNAVLVVGTMSTCFKSLLEQALSECWPWAHPPPLMHDVEQHFPPRRSRS